MLRPVQAGRLLLVEKSAKASKALEKMLRQTLQKKKFVENAPKLEDVLPMEQVASFYAFEPELKQHNLEQRQAQNANKINDEETKNKKNNARIVKKSKQEQSNIPTKPRTLEEAMKSFNINEFKTTIMKVKNQYPDNFMLWLRDAALYLNVSLTTENPNVELEEPVDPFSQRPVSIITKETKKILIQLLEECGDFSRQSGYETLLANMGHDLAKGFSVHGYVILLQLMSEVYPTLATIQTIRFTELIKSYQNKQNVGIALLWALGQCGRKDLSSGLKIWTEYMRPLLRLRHYTRFVVSYLSGLLKMHASTINSANLAKGPRIIYPSQYFLIFDAIFNDATSLSKELQKEMMDQYPSIKTLAIGDCSADHELFPEFLRRLDDFLLLSNGPNSYKNELLVSLSQCVANNPDACISHWQQMYRAHLHSSSLLLCHLDDNNKVMLKSKHFKEASNLLNFFELLSAFKDYNDTCSSKKDGLAEASKSCKSLLKKISTELNGSNGWFPWRLCSVLLFVSIISLVNMDVNRKGSFKKSSTGLFLEDIGLYDKTIEYHQFGSDLYLVSKEWTMVKLPIYYEAAKENAGPFATTLSVKIGVAWNEVKEFITHLVIMANDYLPGLKEKIIVISNDASRIANDVSDWLYEAMNLMTKYLIFFSQASLTFLKEAYEASLLCIQDIVNGKIDLSDVYTGSQKMLEKTVARAGEYYQYAMDHIKVQMK